MESADLVVALRALSDPAAVGVVLEEFDEDPVSVQKDHVGRCALNADDLGESFAVEVRIEYLLESERVPLEFEVFLEVRDR